MTVQLILCILPFITIGTKFLSFDTEMNGYHCFNFTEKRTFFIRSVSPKQPSNFHFDPSLKLSQGEVHYFSGEVQNVSGEVQNVSGEVQNVSGEVRNDLRGGAHPPHTSP